MCVYVCVCLCIGLNEFMALLDSRLSAKHKKHPHPITSLVAKKVRKEGDLSESLPPTDAPRCNLSAYYGVHIMLVEPVNISVLKLGQLE